MYRLQQFFVLLGLLCAVTVYGQVPGTAAPAYVAEIELQTEQEFSELLSRAEHLFLDGELGQGREADVVLVLHGPVLRSFMRENYLDSRGMVDQAASLSALGVIEIQACRTWLGQNGLQESGLQPFVGVVSLGSAEVDRLVRDEGYIEF